MLQMTSISGTNIIISRFNNSINTYSIYIILILQEEVEDVRTLAL